MKARYTRLDESLCRGTTGWVPTSWSRRLMRGQKGHWGFLGLLWKLELWACLRVSLTGRQRSLG